MAKVVRDKDWWDNSNNKALKTAQSIIDKHLENDIYKKYLADKWSGKEKIVIIEIENTIWIVTDEKIPEEVEPVVTINLSK